MVAFQIPMLSGSYLWPNNDLQHSNLWPWLKKINKKNTSRRQQSVMQLTIPLPATMISRTTLAEETGPHSTSPFTWILPLCCRRLHTNSVAIERSHRNRAEKKKKEDICASCQTWNRACAFVCDREKRREDISGCLRVWRRDRRTERVNNSWISVMCYRECRESRWRRRRGRKRKGHGETERRRVLTPALFLARAVLIVWSSGDCSFGGFSCSPYLDLIFTGSMSVQQPLHLSACSFARAAAELTREQNWDESVINWRDSIALYLCVLHTWLLRPRVCVCLCECVCLSLHSH